jgi:hypothetical protein
MDVTTGSNTVLSETAGGCAEERRSLYMIDFRCPEGVAILTAPQETNTPLSDKIKSRNSQHLPNKPIFRLLKHAKYKSPHVINAI